MTVDRNADAGPGNSLDLDDTARPGANTSASAQPGSTRTADAPALEFRPGRWIANWDAENKEQWETAGRSMRRTAHVRMVDRSSIDWTAGTNIEL